MKQWTIWVCSGWQSILKHTPTQKCELQSGLTGNNFITHILRYSTSNSAAAQLHNPATSGRKSPPQTKYIHHATIQHPASLSSSDFMTLQLGRKKTTLASGFPVSWYFSTFYSTLLPPEQRVCWKFSTKAHCAKFLVPDSKPPRLTWSYLFGSFQYSEPPQKTVDDDGEGRKFKVVVARLLPSYRCKRTIQAATSGPRFRTRFITQGRGIDFSDEVDCWTKLAMDVWAAISIYASVDAQDIHRSEKIWTEY